MTTPDTATPPTAPVPTSASGPVTAEPLHDDPVIAKALEGLTDEQRETLLTQGGKSALTKAKAEKTAAKEAAATAAEEARKDLAQTIGKALGLVDDETADPARLTEALTTSQAEAKQANLELAVFKAAGTTNADALKLLDSRSFMASLADIDPADPTALAAAISEAVTANPALALDAPAATPRTPAPNRAQGAGGAPALQPRDQFAALIHGATR